MVTKWAVCFDGESIWQGMLADIESAQVSIELEQFSFYDDEAGRKFLELFELKLKQGVAIRLICDAVNSWPMFSSPYFKKLQALGLQSTKFNPVDILHPSKALFRIHKKTLIIDSRIAWVGGLGIKAKFKNFRDTQVRLEGPVVEQIRLSFENLWKFPNLESKALAAAKPDGEFNYLVNYNGFQKKEIYEWLRHRVSNARKQIYFSTSYFYPDRNFFQLILNKAREGLDIKMILRGKDDEFFPLRFSASFFEQALKNGIGLYRYNPKIMHAKTMIIDDEASIGSCNLDKFSFYYNLEANITSRNMQFVKAIKIQFAEDLKSSSQVYLQDWRNRPLHEQALEALIWPIHTYL